ncbi:MAG TPA: EAL domain-containing response regulator [Mycobacteriales bacterium]|nr:EAL domain-containing response regulator [Mycobacteriales bacterium]
MNQSLAPFATMTVLVIDDNPINVDLLKAMLKSEGLPRIICETEARRVAGMLPLVNPDLILLDLHMPHVNGYQVLDQIRDFAGGTYLPVLVLTADVTPEARNRALEHGARDFLTKPLDVTEVMLRIANLLQTRQLYADLRRTVHANGVNGSSSSNSSHGPNGSVELDEPRVRDVIQNVIDDRRLAPFFQPVVDIHEQVTVGYEALARFVQPSPRGPAGWFQDAHQVGLGFNLEWLAVTQALSFLETIPPECFLALNMSPSTILHLRHQPLCSAEFCPQIVVELTEHVPVEDYAALQVSLAEVRENGARLAADDLGAGYAGFRHLIALEPDIIKLDISLVNDIHRNRPARALARALMAFATDVGATVIAEGVENADDLAELRELGVRWAQGYFLGRPAPLPSHGALPA